MHKRILAIATGALLGTMLALSTMQLASWWDLWPRRELDTSTAYFREVLDLVHRNYVDEKVAADLPKLTREALSGMLEELDPHSEFMDESQYSMLREDMESEFGGIGVRVEMRDGHIVVIAPIVGSPAYVAGVLREDQIVSVEGKRLDRPKMDEVVDLLRGKPKTPVKVGFYRPSSQENYTRTIVRDIVRMESVEEVKLLPDAIGYLQITQFSRRTGEELQEAVKSLQNQGMRGLVIDVRNNPGGLLDSVVEAAQPFFDRGELIVYTQGREPQDREEFRAQSRKPRLTVPIAVLINAGSASAAEILSGSLKDTRRAVIVGERSFGKGSVQSVFRLRNGEGMRLTTARYYTPSGITIHQKGVEPDVEVVMTPEEDRKLSLQRARADIETDAEFEERFGFAPIQDRQLEAAVTVLKGALLLDARSAAQVKAKGA